LLTIIELLGGGHHSMCDNEQVSNSISDFDQVLSDIMAPTSDEKPQSRGGKTSESCRMQGLLEVMFQALPGACQPESKVVSGGTAQRPDVLVLAGVALCVATLEGSGQGPFRCCSEF
jgi:hypothetical protein